MLPQYAYFASQVFCCGSSPRICSAISTRSFRHGSIRMLASDRSGTSDAIERQVVLLSGGVESSTLLHHVHRCHDAVLGLFFRYGQRAVAQEEEAARAQCADLGIDDFLVADLTNVGESIKARQKERLHVPLPHRNLVLLSLGVSIAAQEGGRVFLAVSRDDLTWYPSASTEFLKSFQNCARTVGVEVETPLIELGKADIVRMGLDLGVNFEKTWSCMIGRRRACGRCVQCRARKKAFLDCGLDKFT